MIRQCCKIYGCPHIAINNVFDVMGAYAEYWGDWNDYYSNYKWQKLTNACIQQEIKIENSHSAIGDCKLTLELIRKISKQGS